MMHQITSFLRTSCLRLPFIFMAVPGLLQAQTAFEHVHALTMADDGVREDWTVVVEGDRIVAVGPADEVNVPESAQRIDGTGKYLIPGLAEMHGHIPSSSDAPRAYIESVLFLYVANGITTVRGLQGGSGQLALREATASGEVLGPSLYLAGPAFSGSSIDSPEQADRRVREQATEGWDYLKVLWGLTVEEYDAMAQASKEEGIPMVGHVPSEVGLVHAIEMGQQTIDHLDGYIEYLRGGTDMVDPERLEHAIALTKEHGVWVIPTMALWETILGVPSASDMDSYEELVYVPPDMVAGWARAQANARGNASFSQERVDGIAADRIELLRALNESGARILMGTDAPQRYSVPGFSLRREIPFMVAAGMTPMEILVSGTRSVGEYLRDEDTFGTITEGSRADLVLLNANPLEDVMHVFDQAGVMVRGRWVPKSEIEERLAALAASYE